MAVEFIPKAPSRLQSVKGAWVIVWPLVLLLLGAGAYAGLAYYESILNTQIKETEEKIQAVEVGRDVAAEQKVLTLDGQLSTLEELLKNHIYFSKFLAAFEGMIHPKIYIKNFSINVPTNKLDVSGDAASFTVLSKQILTLTKNPTIEKIQIGGLSLSSEGKIGFTLNLTYKPELMKK